jgi:methylglutaconyl-CoA hydratase/polyketide biosynthesis enoyl-CoA hydratase PksH
MTLGTRGIPAAEAHAYGLVDELAEGSPGPALREQLRRILRSSPQALAETKRYYDRLTAADLDQQIETGLDQFTAWLARDDVVEGVRLFGAGFAPCWFTRYEGGPDVAGRQDG